MNLVEPITSLERDVQSYKADHERIMKCKEKQDGIQIRLLKSLYRIEKKVYKETYLRNSKSHISHDKRRESRSVDRYHHHLPRHSVKRAESSSSPFPIRNHSIRYGLD
jgi:hypothetical protein